MLNPDKTAANIAIVQNCFALLGAGDASGFVAQMTDDVMWEPVGDRKAFPLFGPWAGKQGVMAFLAKMSDTHQFTAFEPQTFHAAQDKVFVTGRYALKMRSSGISTEADWVMVFTLRDGFISSFREHTDSNRLVQAYRGN
jgi:ketosteroid isomerase-like protein